MSRREIQATATELKERFGGLLLDVVAGARVVVTRHGTPLAALVSLEELETLRAGEKRGRHG